jgi:hypothetical protein
MTGARRRELPRPLVPNRDMLAATPSPFAPGALADADALVRAEALRLIEDDAAQAPPEGAPPAQPARKRRPLLPLPLADRHAAAALIRAEVRATWTQTRTPGPARAPPRLAAPRVARESERERGRGRASARGWSAAARGFVPPPSPQPPRARLRGVLVRDCACACARNPVPSHAQSPVPPPPAPHMHPRTPHPQLEAATASGALPPVPEPPAFERAHGASLAQLVYLPAEQRYAPRVGLSADAELAAERQRFQLVRSWAVREGKRADKAQKKPAVLIAGYQKRADALRAALVDGGGALRVAQLELQCYEAQAASEAAELARRLGDARRRLDAARAREAALQSEYASAMMAKEAELSAANRARAAAAAP